MLGYIANDTRAFKTFVANRAHMMQENSKVEQWKYVPSKENPANDTSRGTNFKNLANIDRWFKSPKFLWKPQSSWETSGLWVREIRTARSILNALLKRHGRSLNNKALHTLLIEVKAIVNSQPMTTETINDFQSHVPLFPSSLLTMKLKVVKLPNLEALDQQIPTVTNV